MDDLDEVDVISSDEQLHLDISLMWASEQEQHREDSSIKDIFIQLYVLPNHVPCQNKSHSNSTPAIIMQVSAISDQPLVAERLLMLSLINWSVEQNRWVTTVTTTSKKNKPLHGLVT